MMYIRLCSLFLLPAILSACSPSANSSGGGDASADRGFDAMDKGDHATAVMELNAAISAGVKRHKLEDIHTSLGNAYNELDRFDEALAAHQKALDINPRHYKAWVNKGVVHRLRNEFDEAEKCYTTALGIDPNYAELHASLGALYVFKEEPDKAIASLEKAIQLDKSLAIAHSNVALAYAMKGRFDEADASLKHAISLGYKNGPIIQERIDELKPKK